MVHTPCWDYSDLILEERRSVDEKTLRLTGLC